MPHPLFSSALILVNTSSESRGGRDHATKAGDVEEVTRRLRSTADEHLDLIHWLLGPTDMIVHLYASSPEELVTVMDTVVLPLKSVRYNYIATTETLLITHSEGKVSLADLEPRPTRPTAWIFANTNVGSADVGFNLLDENGFLYVAHVVGRYDLVFLVQTEDLPQLSGIVDKTLRKLHFLTSTDTRLVLM
jgi:DNA-binding Lrp family transcriptional regulator